MNSKPAKMRNMLSTCGDHAESRAFRSMASLQSFPTSP
jgi:hypothetical protein